MKDVQCYEFFGGIALKNHAFSFFSFHSFADDLQLQMSDPPDKIYVLLNNNNNNGYF